MDTLKIGETIKWASAAGPLTGTIEDIVLAKNGYDKLIPWILVECGLYNRVRLCATDDYLSMMKVEKV